MTDTYTLNNGIKIPKIGFGTWLIEENDKARQAVKTALQTGYRLVDTAEAYGNEVGVGQGIRESGVDRSQIFVVTKLRAEFKNYKEAAAAIQKSLSDLGLEYIDLMIIHSPKPWDKFDQEDRYLKGNLETWKALEEAYEAGKIKAIGVSNFEQEDLKNLLDNVKIKPMVNQILAHIGHMPLDLIKFSQDNNILVQAYSPFSHGDMFSNQEIKTIADKYSVSISQLALRYLLQFNLLPIAKSSNIEHMTNNIKLDFEIDDTDVQALTNLKTWKYSSDSQVYPVYKK